MDLPESSEELVQELAKTEAELAELDRREVQLQSALDDVEHDLRRCNDALERSGWRSVEAQARNTLLTQSRTAIVGDRDRIRDRRARLSEHLTLIRQRLNEGEQHG